MNLEEISKGLIAFKGNTLIYASAQNETAEPVFSCRTLSFKEMQLIDKNPALLNAQD